MVTGQLSAMRHLAMRPVTVWETPSVRRTLADVENASHFLLIQWPHRYMDSALHQSARRAALDALNAHVPAEAFRAAFLAAAQEADILAD